MSRSDWLPHIVLAVAVAAPAADLGAVTGNEGKASVQVVADESARRVDVTVDGRPFTSYVWPERLKKPVLFPIRTASGAPITRGYPLEPRPGERVDHPHHVGLWLNHGDVNGLDFWNNSEAIKPATAAKYGTIVHRAVKGTKSGPGRGELQASADWLAADGRALLREDTTFVFHASAGLRAVDRITTLTALGERVVFRDSKEGMIGLRVARALEQPAPKAEIFTDQSGTPTTVARLDNTGVTGHYTSSEGKTGDAVWATRAPWTMLSGTISGEPVTVAIFDHPANPGHPTHWHARGYGLFAANPFGAKAYSDGKEETNFTLPPRGSVTLKHRVLVLSEPNAADGMPAAYRRFVDELK
ncbi:MAG TPA: PmoA family protein [Vicinamibacteria bacterium]|nr:PmoA family protein [Vicinamibacteria bacterium]